MSGLRSGPGHTLACMRKWNADRTRLSCAVACGRPRGSWAWRPWRARTLIAEQAMSTPGAPSFIRYYNRRRPHSACGAAPIIGTDPRRSNPRTGSGPSAFSAASGGGGSYEPLHGAGRHIHRTPSPRCSRCASRGSTGCSNIMRRGAVRSSIWCSCWLSRVGSGAHADHDRWGR